jgi:hypothetical protein
MVDLDDTTHCPRALGCEVCTAGTPLGVYCLTLCGHCAERGEHDPGSLLRLGWGEAARRAGAHADHLGIDLDEMAEVLRAEAGEG